MNHLERTATLEEKLNTAPQGVAAGVGRNFPTMRRALFLALVASIVLPVVTVCVFAYFDYQRRVGDALNQIDRLSRVAEEQSVKVLDLNRQIADRIEEHLQNADETELRKHEAGVHDYLKAIVGTLPQMSAIAIFGARGDLVASSLQSPAPRISVAGRPGFEAAKRAGGALSVSAPSKGILSGIDIFATGYALVSPNGQFLGVLSIALKRGYFSGFYSQLVSDGPSQLIGLYRDDGTILVRFPDPAPAATLAFNAETRAFIASHPRAGTVKSFSRVDGVQRWLSYRQVANYPIYVIGGISTSAIWRGWRNGLLTLVAVVIGPMCGILALISFSLVRLKAEEQAWLQWRSETEMRESAEAASRQLRRMGALGNLVATVAHDFNNLLMVVDANMELARRKGFNRVEKEVNAVQRASASARRLARRLMSVARKQPLRHERVDICDWLAGARGMIETSLGDMVILHVDCPNDIGAVTVDPAELESAAINLAVNAKDAMPDGGRLTIAVEWLLAQQDNDGLAAGRYVSIAFADTGVGMSQDVAGRAFEPLFTTKPRGEGTGLGLAQVRAMCEHAGGTATIESVQHAGTTVRMILPQHDSAAVGPSHQATHHANVGTDRTVKNTIRILIVEDNQEVADGIVAVLEVLGGVVTHDPTGDAAFARLENARGEGFDLVLSDIQMPGAMNGLDLAEAVRRRWPAQRVALMTGYADELDRAENVGVTVLAKPFDMGELERLLSACVE